MEDHRRLGGPLSRKVYKQWESPGEEQRKLPVTATGGRYSPSNVSKGMEELSLSLSLMILKGLETAGVVFTAAGCQS